MCSFSLDERYVIFVAQRYAGRDAPWDIFRCSTDGVDLRQLTDAEDIFGVAVSPDADKVFFVTGGELHAIGLHSLEEEEVCEVPAKSWVEPRSIAAVDGAGKQYFAMGYNAQGRGVLFKVDIEAAKATVLHESQQQNHVTADWAGSVVSFNDWTPNGVIPSLINSDGTGYHAQAFPKFAHNTWFGKATTIQGTLVPPGQAIATFTDGDAEPTILTQGRYYWHSSASRDGQWVVSDTNWPQEGIFLLHVPSKTVTYVCDPRSSCSHPQWTHPHPSLSPNMRYVLFNSDLTGVGQVYVAELTDEFLAQAASGYLLQPGYITEYGS
jgi:hypothetical protein